MKDGYGRITWPDGRMYCGAFTKGKREGRGIQTNAEGTTVHCGLWKNDSPYIKGETPSPDTSMDFAVSYLSDRDQDHQGFYESSVLNKSEEDIVFMESQAVAVADDYPAARSSVVKTPGMHAKKETLDFPAHSKASMVSRNNCDSLASTVKTIPATPSKLVDDVSSMGGSFELDQKEPSVLLGPLERISL